MIKRLSDDKILLIFFVIVCTSVYLFLILGQIKYSNNQEKELENEINNTKSWITQRDSLQMLILNNLEVNDIILFNESKDSIALESLIEEKFCLFLIVPENTCGYCLDSEIGNIKSLHNQIPDHCLKIITKYRFKKEIRDFRIFNNIELTEVLAIRNLNINFNLEDLHIPYYVLISRNLELIKVFIPKADMKELSTEFFNDISKKYFYFN